MSRDDTVHAPTQNAVVLKVQLHGEKDDEILRAHSWVYYFEKKYYAYAGATDTAGARLGQHRRQNVIGVLASDVLIRNKDTPVLAAVIVSGIAEVPPGQAKKHTDLGTAKNLTTVRINYRNLLMASTGFESITAASNDAKLLLIEISTPTIPPITKVNFTLQVTKALHDAVKQARVLRVRYKINAVTEIFSSGTVGNIRGIDKELTNAVTDWTPVADKWQIILKEYNKPRNIGGTNNLTNWNNAKDASTNTYTYADALVLSVNTTTSSNTADSRAHVVTASSFGGASAAAATSSTPSKKRKVPTVLGP